MSRISETFSKIKKEERKALVAFVTGGYPSIEENIKAIEIIVKQGADIIEIGIPYSDPLADGMVIEESYMEAIKKGVKINDVFKIIERVRKFTKVPIVIMSYYNPIYCYGLENFNEKFKAVGGDGIIIPDLPLEERELFLEKCNKKNLDLIPLVAPTSEKRIEEIVKNASGFIYCVSVNGITGERKAINTDLEKYMKFVKSKTNLPALVGFGISNVETVNRVKECSDGVIIGSAVVKRIKNLKNGYNEVERFISEIKSSLG